jgi:hypothetical protein
MEADALSLWPAVVAASEDLGELQEAWAAFSSCVTDDVLEEEAPLIAEAVLVGRSQGVVGVLEACFKGDGGLRSRAAPAAPRAPRLAA